MSKLTKISRPEAPGGLRTETVEGNVDFNPEVGKTFRMTAAPLDKTMSVRYIETTIVTDVKKEGDVITFRTQTGSVYRLE